MSSGYQTEYLDRVLPMFKNGPGAAAIRKYADQFWQNQDRVLDSMSGMANGWFERRHAGTRAAQDAAVKICTAENPLDAMREYQEWANGAFSRLMADAMAWQQQAAIFGAAVVQPVSPSQDTSGTAGLANKAGKLDAA